MTEQDLTGRVAIVTGAANGIGKAVATTLAERGAHIVVADVETGPAQAVTAALPTKAALWAGDLASAGATDQVVATALDTFGRLDIVVNNAGYSRNAAIEDMTEDMFRDVLEIDLVVPWLLLKVAAPHLKASAEASGSAAKVVNVASIAAYGSAHGQSNYTSAKAGLIGLTKSLAREWGPRNVCVNAVAPGAVDTRLTQRRTPDSVLHIGARAIPYGLSAEAAAFYTAALPMIPLARYGRVDEVAATVAFLSTAGSDYITGQVVNLSGGAPAGMTS